MSKNIIEISDSEKLVLFEFLNRIINDKYDELSGDLFEVISEEHVLSTILCQLEKTMTEPLNPDYKELLLKAREDVRNHY